MPSTSTVLLARVYLLRSRPVGVGTGQVTKALLGYIIECVRIAYHTSCPVMCRKQTDRTARNEEELRGQSSSTTTVVLSLRNSLITMIPK